MMLAACGGGEVNEQCDGSAVLMCAGCACIRENYHILSLAYITCTYANLLEHMADVDERVARMYHVMCVCERARVCVFVCTHHPRKLSRCSAHGQKHLLRIRSMQNVVYVNCAPRALAETRAPRNAHASCVYILCTLRTATVCQRAAAARSSVLQLH